MTKLVRLGLCIALLCAVVLSAPGEARADLYCNDCIGLCILGQCGFLIDPACEAAVYDYCRYYQCAEYCT